MKRKHHYFTDDFKLKVVKEFLETDISHKDIMLKYGIKGVGNIRYWMQKFGLSEPTEEQIKLEKVMSQEQNKTVKEKELEAKVQELENALDYERLKNLALDTLIDVAERDLKISIRKKPGSKQ